MDINFTMTNVCLKQCAIIVTIHTPSHRTALLKFNFESFWSKVLAAHNRKYIVTIWWCDIIHFHCYILDITAPSYYKWRQCSTSSTHRDHLALSGHVGRSVRQTQLCLQGIEVCLQFCFLLNTRRFVLTPVSTVLFKFLLHTSQRIVCLAAVQPWHCATDPLQQLCENQKINFPLLSL